MLRGMTAQYMIRRTSPVRPVETVALHAGEVGKIAWQGLKAPGARGIGTSGSDEDAAVARPQGRGGVMTGRSYAERSR
jgi:NADPH2:quinone reductase